MTARSLSLAALSTLMFGVMIGCSDNAVDSTASSDPFALYSIDESSVSDTSEIPSCDRALSPDSTGDPTRRGGHGHGRGHRGGERGEGWGQFEVRSYRRILGQLNLTDDQKAAITVCFTDYRTAAKASAETYRAARVVLHDSLGARLAVVRAALADGSITEEEGRAQVTAIVAEYHAQVEPLNAAFRSEVEGFKANLDACIESNLDADQLALWASLRG